ncbi:unnamed protein product [marine sediment metagenome]|uniref:Uncharacterized protein n=1 Tax=marine sediment metagenome TaxID=412755 RepID=X1GMH6_9ZZZZ
MVNEQKQVCTLRIMFPVNSDEQAIAAKKRIAEALKDDEHVQIHFALIPSPEGAIGVPSVR